MDTEFPPRVVTAEAIRQFGEWTGDRSRIHFDPEFGRASGFEGTIAHGLLTASWALGAVSLEFAKEHAGSPDPPFPTRTSFRLSKVVQAGDTLAFQVDGLPNGLDYDFEGRNQRGESTIRGTLEFHRGNPDGFPNPPPAFETATSDSCQQPPLSSARDETLYAEDLCERGRVGETRLEAVGTERVETFADMIGARNASNLPLGSLFAAPMLSFCLGFSDFLQELLALPLPETGSAGHVGDAWTLHRPIRPEEPLKTRFRPLAAVASKSQPSFSLVTFGFQRLDERDDVVQSGETVIMIGRRPNR